MKKVAILLENGFEEIEALTVKDVLERSKIKCHLVSTKGYEYVTGAHNITVKVDKMYNYVSKDELIIKENEEKIKSLNEYDMIVLPGGMPGAKNLAENQMVINEIKEFDKNNKLIGAICAAPAIVLTKAEIVNGRKVTSYPGMEQFLESANYSEELVVKDGNLITSRGPATALLFAYEIVKALGEDPSELKNEMLWNKVTK